MSHAMTVAPASPRVPAVSLAANRTRRQRLPSKTPNKDQNQNLPQNSALGFGIKKKNPVWQCVQNCGACCKLDKGLAFPYPEEIFDDPSDIELYKSLIGPDGLCIHYEKSTRKCSIYADRPYFCRVEPGIFKELYGIDKKKFQKEACSEKAYPANFGENLTLERALSKVFEPQQQVGSIILSTVDRRTISL